MTTDVAQQVPGRETATCGGWCLLHDCPSATSRQRSSGIIGIGIGGDLRRSALRDICCLHSTRSLFVPRYSLLSILHQLGISPERSFCDKDKLDCLRTETLRRV